MTNFFLTIIAIELLRLYIRIVAVERDILLIRENALRRIAEKVDRVSDTVNRTIVVTGSGAVGSEDGTGAGQGGIASS